MAEIGVFFDNPPQLAGNSETKLQQLYNTLFTMSTKLNEAFMQVSIQEKEVQQLAAAAGGGTESGNLPSTDDFGRLKSLIIKNAEIVRTEMDEIRTRLSTQIDAISEQFGEYQANLEAEISATAEGILQEYHIEERITTVEDETEDFIKQTSQYIFSGLLDANTQTYGIAIGYNVTDESTGQLVDANKMATFTADRLSFWLNDTEVAYFSNNVFHIAHGEVTDSMRMGSYIWKVFANGSMGLMKE